MDLVCTGADCQRSCLPRLAESALSYGQGDWGSATERILDAVRASERRVDNLTVFEYLDPAFQFLGAEGDPQPTYEEYARRLTWKVDMLDRGGVTLRYEVAATQIGTATLRRRPIGGFVVYTDSYDAHGHGTLTSPTISVADGLFTVALPITARHVMSTVKPFLQRR